MKYRAWSKVTDDGWTYHVREDGVTFSCERVSANGVEYRSLGPAAPSSKVSQRPTELDGVADEFFAGCEATVELLVEKPAADETAPDWQLDGES